MGELFGTFGTEMRLDIETFRIVLLFCRMPIGTLKIKIFHWEDDRRHHMNDSDSITAIGRISVVFEHWGARGVGYSRRHYLDRPESRELFYDFLDEARRLPRVRVIEMYTN